LEARWNRLYVYAYRTGQIREDGYGPRDPYRSLKEELIFSDIENQFASELGKMTYFWHVVLGKPTGWEEDRSEVDGHQRDAIRAWNDVGKHLLPWYKDFVSRKEKSLEQLWKEFKEQEKDPEYAAWLKVERAKLRDIGVQARSEADGLSQAAERLRALKEEQMRRARLRGAKRP